MPSREHPVTQLAGPELVRAVTYERQPSRARRFRRNPGTPPTRRGTPT